MSKYEVGDRVEVLSPPPCTVNAQDQVGPGKVTEINLGSRSGLTHRVKVDCQKCDHHGWFYREDQLRPLGETVKQAPKVGERVRLTGVVTAAGGESPFAHVAIDGSRSVASIRITALEVIRQPFKRGETVWHVVDDLEFVVVNDEDEGKVTLVRSVSGGAVSRRANANRFERRP